VLRENALRLAIEGRHVTRTVRAAIGMVGNSPFKTLSSRYAGLHWSTASSLLSLLACGPQMHSCGCWWLSAAIAQDRPPASPEVMPPAGDTVSLIYGK
jgi:hypothetical protein